jgi:hypothetical protein
VIGSVCPGGAPTVVDSRVVRKSVRTPASPGQGQGPGRQQVVLYARVLSGAASAAARNLAAAAPTRSTEPFNGQSG